MEFMSYPTTVKMLAAELIAACDAYLARKIAEEEQKLIILDIYKVIISIFL